MSEDPALRGAIDAALRSVSASVQEAGFPPTDIPFVAMKVAAAAFAIVIPPGGDAMGVAMLERQFRETVAHLRQQGVGRR